jgi:beta-glucanase (GH16 family)
MGGGVGLNVIRMMSLALPQAMPAKEDSLIVGTPDVFQPMDGDKSGWTERNGANGDPFNCEFKPNNISFNNGVMSLKLTKNGGKYYAGEYRTTEEEYSFGYYETRMKAAKGAGLMAGSFFTYAGHYGHEDHNEIDFEVLGRYPTKVQLNYYYAGTGKDQENKKLIDLGFDASQGFHNYGFLWSKNSIKWFIDGKLVHTATENIPQDPCKIMVNLWPGTSEEIGWLGELYNGGTVSAQYDWVKYAKVNGTPAKETAAEPVKSEPAKNEPPKNEPVKNEPKQSSPANVKGKQLFNGLVLSQEAFNGASSGGISGDKIKLFALNSTNACISVELRSAVKGHLVFDFKGKVTGGDSDGGFTVKFFRRDPDGVRGKDVPLGEGSIVPTSELLEASVDIPEGTDKINFMLVGKGSVNVEITKVRIAK